MKSIETPKISALARVAATRLAPEVSKEARSGGPRAATAQAAGSASASVLSAGEPPVDSARVEAIRKAVEQGTYPILPAKIADAMIAAGYLLRTKK